MGLRTVFSIVVILSAAWAGPSMAQQTLGDLVASGGYDWIIGRWVASFDDDRKMEFRFDWVLDKHAVLSGIQIGGDSASQTPESAAWGPYQYQGLIMLAPGRAEPFDEGADDRGATWKGTWFEDSTGLVHRIERTEPNGLKRKEEIVFDTVDTDTVTIAIYATGASGARNAKPWNKMTYKRQQAKADPVSAATETAGHATDYQKLGDIVSEGGYEWMTGKWKATQGDQTYELEFKPILSMHAALADVKVDDVKYLVMITYVPSRQEVVDFGVNNRGGMWKGTWEQDGSNALNKIEYTKADGTTLKVQHVYVRTNNDEMNVRQYEVGTDGTRAAESNRDLIFKRQKPATQAK